MREARSSIDKRATNALAGVTLIKRVASLLLLGLSLTASRADLGAQEKKNVADPEIDWAVFLPEGEGKAEVALSCTGCHDLRQVIVQKKSRVAWRTSVQKMVSAYKAPVDKEDLPVLVAYLSANFGEKNPIDHLPMNINSSSAAALARLPGVSASAASAIVESRMRAGEFASVEDLLRVKDIDKSTFDKIKGYLKTKD